MIRLLQIALLVVLAVVAWRLVQRWLGAPPSGQDDTPEFQPTGRCGKCGTHVPTSELDDSGTCARCRGTA